MQVVSRDVTGGLSQTRVTFSEAHPNGGRLLAEHLNSGFDLPDYSS
jgi:hypothetical protein